MAPKDLSKTAVSRRFALSALWALGGLALALLLARLFVGDVYRVDSSSMEPFLHGDRLAGERVLVLYRSRPELERFDPLVALLPGEKVPVVKRAVGLPGESVQVVGGDLLIDGKRLPGSAPRPAPVALYDQDLVDLDSAFQLNGRVWRRDGPIWHLDAAGLGPPVEALAVWTARLLDGRLDGSGQLHAGSSEIGDAELELELAPGAGAGFFFITLTEQADSFTLELSPRAGGLHARLLHTLVRDEPAVLGETDVALPADGWLCVRLANSDNTLTVDLGERRAALTSSYARNVPLEGLPDRNYKHLRPRVAFGAADLDVALRRVRLRRDLFYSARGTHGVDAPLRLGPDELFLLGDNSAESLDSREFGPVGLDAVLGLPLAVVWPPSAWRRLGGPARRP